MTALLNLCLPGAVLRLGQSQPHSRKSNNDDIVELGSASRVNREELIELFHDELRRDFAVAA